MLVLSPLVVTSMTFRLDFPLSICFAGSADSATKVRLDFDFSIKGLTFSCVLYAGSVIKLRFDFDFGRDGVNTLEAWDTSGELLVLPG